jgi:hypothetical protein
MVAMFKESTAHRVGLPLSPGEPLGLVPKFVAHEVNINSALTFWGWATLREDRGRLIHVVNNP